jgi:hypothetical protein
MLVCFIKRRDSLGDELQKSSTSTYHFQAIFSDYKMKFNVQSALVITAFISTAVRCLAQASGLC